MTQVRHYSFRARKKKPLLVKFRRPSQQSIDALAIKLLEDSEGDGAFLIEAYRSLDDEDIVELLSLEFMYSPKSPISQAFRQKIRDLCLKHATTIATEILVSD